MSFAKQSQNLGFEGLDIPVLLPKDDRNELAGPFMKSLHEPLIVLDEPDLEVHEDEKEPEIVLTLDHIPGGLDQTEIVEPTDLEVDEKDQVEVAVDPSSYTPKSFLAWLSNKLQHVPPHSGKDTAGIERAIAYLESADKDISKAVRMDLNNEIDIVALEKARDEIQRGIDRLYERLEKIKSSKYPKRKKKRSNQEEEGLVKEAGTTKITGITITVPLLISGLARICMNGMVSQGKDIERTFETLVKKYALSVREQFELMQLLDDMGYSTPRRDRGLLRDEPFNPTSEDNVEMSANYPG